jgi:hypothetical protein
MGSLLAPHMLQLKTGSIIPVPYAHNELYQNRTPQVKRPEINMLAVTGIIGWHSNCR